MVFAMCDMRVDNRIEARYNKNRNKWKCIDGDGICNNAFLQRAAGWCEAAGAADSNHP
mgnify:CR=1 FL=1